MDTERGPRTLITLPGEIQNKIFSELGPLDLIPLRGTCQHFRNIIAPLTMRELLAAESSELATHRDVYGCCLCLCLRRSSEFADPMKKKDKRRGGGLTRFCVQCGLKPPPRKNGYSRGAHITIEGVVSVLCMFCVRYMPPAKDLEGKNSKYCLQCWPRTTDGLEMRRLEEARVEQERQEREQRRKERAERRRRRREAWGASASNTDEDTDEEFNWALECQMRLSLEESDWRDIFD